MNPWKFLLANITRRYSSRAFMSLIVAVVMFHLHPAEFGGNNLVAILIAFIGFNAVDNFIKIKKTEKGEKK